MFSGNQPVRKIEVPSNNSVQKRFSTNGLATAELINELQTRDTSKEISSNKGEE